MAFSKETIDQLALIFSQNIQRSVEKGIAVPAITLEDTLALFYALPYEDITALFMEYDIDLNPAQKPYLRVIKGGKSQE